MTNQNNIPKDPTINVKEMIDNAVERIDDLRIVEVKRIDEKFAGVEEKFKDCDTKYQIQFTAAKDAVGAALEGTKEAIVKNDANTDKRFDLLSEKIDGVVEAISKNSGAQGIYVTHNDLTVALDKLQTSIEITLRPVVTFMNSQTGKDKGIGLSWSVLLSVVSLLGGLLAIFIAVGVK